MAKVIVERPRLKGWAWTKPKGYGRRLRAYGDDGPPSREGIKRRWSGGTKWLNEHLGPLRRYLDAQVGRPWNIVFAEICQHINRNSAVQDHVRDHVDDYVITHVIIIDGVPCCGDGNRGYGRPLSELPWRPWYVCPRTGLLRKNQPRSKREIKNRAREQRYTRYVRVSNSLHFHFIGGVWYKVELKPLPLDPSLCKDRDVLLDRPITLLSEETARRCYGAAVYAISARPLAKRELKQYPIPYDLWK